MRHNAFSDSLSDMIIEHSEGLISFSSMVTFPKSGIRASYTDAVKRAIYDFTKPYLEYTDGLSIIFARHPDVSPWTLLKIFENIDWGRRLRGCGVFDPHDTIPLQAADFVMHLVNRRWAGKSAHSFERVRDGFQGRGKMFSSQIGSTADLSRVWDGTATNGRPASPRQCD